MCWTSCAAPEALAPRDPDDVLTYHLAYDGAAVDVTVELPTGSPRTWKVPDWRLGEVPLELQPEGVALLDAEGQVRLPPGVERLRYRYPLARASGLKGGAGGAGGHVVAGARYLLKPDPVRPAQPVTIRVDDPPPVLPWELEAGRARLRGADLLWTGFHTFGGRRRVLTHPLGTLALTILPGGDPARDDAFAGWIQAAWEELLTCAEAFPAPRLAVTLVVRPGGRRVGFGQLLRSDPPTIAIDVGAEIDDEGLRQDWVAIHELAHALHPRLEPATPWLSEGLATYAQVVARMRSGRLSPAEAWGQLAWGVGSGRRQAQGRSLAELSARMHPTRAYRAVYWGGALVALELDLAIREASGGARSLDDALARLRAAGRAASLDDVGRAVDAVAGAPVFEAVRGRHLQGPCLGEGPRLLESLGITAGRGDRARLVDGEAAARRRPLERRN